MRLPDARGERWFGHFAGRWVDERDPRTCAGGRFVLRNGGSGERENYQH
jgi:hypothetical protein